MECSLSACLFVQLLHCSHRAKRCVRCQSHLAWFPNPLSTQQVSIKSLKILLIYFPQNWHFWNGVLCVNNLGQSVECR